MSLLIAFATPDDDHIARVASILAEEGVTTLSFSPVASLEVGAPLVNWGDPTLEWRLPRLDGGGPVSFDPSQATFWFRNKHTVDAIRTAADQRESFELLTRQHFAVGFVHNHRLRAVNIRSQVNRSIYKLHQLSVASRYGLRVPRSLISSDKDEILRFVQRGKCIIKPLHVAHIAAPSSEAGPPMVLMTSRITADQVIAAAPEEFSSAPVIVQDEIAKSFELRVVVFGEDLLAYKIDSQKHEISQVDWRWGERLGLTEPVDLDAAVCRSLIDFCRGEGLDTGVFDLIVSTTGETWFLECNPSGQWAMLEDPTQQEIATMFARNIKSVIRSGPLKVAA